MFSISAAWGGLIALSSYNKFHNNCFFDAMIICSVNCGTSLFAGFAIFTVIGHMAHSLGKPVDEVVDSGTHFLQSVNFRIFTMGCEN